MQLIFIGKWRHRRLDYLSAQQSIAVKDAQRGEADEDKVLGRIPESVCVNLLNRYEAERREKQERHKELTGQLAASRETESSVDAWLDMMQDYAQLEELDRPRLVRLIQKIEISEHYTVDDHEERDIHIYYNFVGYIEV